MSNVRWGSYKDYEGPWSGGDQDFVLPGNPVFAEEVMAVITATEGGRYDAINRYDKCIDTQGVIQWCNRARQHSIDDMYGALFEHDPILIAPVTQFLSERGYLFQKNAEGKYRWFLKGAEVDTPKEQTFLYFLNSSGRKGGWDEESKAYAKKSASVAMEVWKSVRAQKIQAEWTLARLNWFLVGSSKQLFKDAPDTDIARAFKAMYWSFAANNPSKSSKALEKFLRESAGKYNPWTEEWLAESARALTYYPRITIYPHRYDKIRPVLEKLYNVDLPDYASELKSWCDTDSVRHFLDPKELQRALIALDHDLGPAGADGVPGKKTRDALKEFEEDMGVENPDGLIDPDTGHLLERALERAGIDLAA